MALRAQVEQHIEVHKYSWFAILVTAFLAVVLQASLPAYFPRAKLLELPLLVTLYFGLSRRNPSTGLLLGMAIGLMQDAISRTYIGLYGIAKTMVGFGAFLLLASLYHAVVGSAPEAPVMGAIGALALLANVICAVLLFRFRTGDSNLRAVWLCSRNDAIGNLAVLAAAGAVFISGTAWPDLLVGLGLAALAIWAGASVIGQARGELRTVAGTAPAE